MHSENNYPKKKKKNMIIKGWNAAAGNYLDAISSCMKETTGMEQKKWQKTPFFGSLPSPLSFLLNLSYLK